jgi:hypothetical protein
MTVINPVTLNSLDGFPRRGEYIYIHLLVE